MSEKTGLAGTPATDALTNAEALADRHGLPGFGVWRAGLERRYTVMPAWYWNGQECRRRYIAHIDTVIDWQRRERKINRGYAGFLGFLAGGRESGNGPRS